MTPAEVFRAVKDSDEPSLVERRPNEIDLSEIPERPISRQGVRGKYASSFSAFPFVEIASDLRDVFPTSEAVNEGLRLLARAAGLAVVRQKRQATRLQTTKSRAEGEAT